MIKSNIKIMKNKLKYYNANLNNKKFLYKLYIIISLYKTKVILLQKYEI